MARKNDNDVFSFDKSSFFWVSKCGACHPGGGPGEYDRDGQLYFDILQNLFGYQPLGRTSTSVYANFDGDYTLMSSPSPSTAKYVLAPWQKTGVSEADCLMCHLDSYGGWTKRQAVLGSGGNLYDYTGNTHRAFQVAPNVGAGWASYTTLGSSPTSSSDFAINYAQGVTAGTLAQDKSRYYYIPKAKVVVATPDASCWNCHSTPDGKKYGRTLDAANDAHKAGGVSCVRCHPAGLAATDPRISGKEKHEFAKGDSMIESVRDELDGTMFDCRQCHVERLDPNSPDPTVAHAKFCPGHFEKIACETCHIPYLTKAPEKVVDTATTGSQISYPWNAFFAGNPVDPTIAQSPWVWYPALSLDNGKIAPSKPLNAVWWGELIGQPGSPDAQVRPYPLWQVRQALRFDGSAPTNPAITAVLSNDAHHPPGGGSDPSEVNTSAEIAAYINVLKTEPLNVAHKDTGGPSFSQTGLGTNPALVKGGRVFYLDSSGQVRSFESEHAKGHPFSVHHNVLPKTLALGYNACSECHAPNSAFFFRKDLADPWNESGAPAYVNAWETMGYTPDRVLQLTEGVIHPHVEINCSDGLDDDNDGLKDCADPDCAGIAPCGPEGRGATCSDGADNDGDGLTDCADPGCAKQAVCR